MHTISTAEQFSQAATLLPITVLIASDMYIHAYWYCVARPALHECMLYLNLYGASIHQALQISALAFAVSARIEER